MDEYNNGNDNMQCCFQHFMRSLSTKVIKTNDIDIVLILMQLHVILSSSVGTFTGRLYTN